MKLEKLAHFQSELTFLVKWSPGITWTNVGPGGRFKNIYELLNLRALKYSPTDKTYIFQCMSKIFCVELPFEIPHEISYS